MAMLSSNPGAARNGKSRRTLCELDRVSVMVRVSNRGGEKRGILTGLLGL
jgi:hypothetical protein